MTHAMSEPSQIKHGKGYLTFPPTRVTSTTWAIFLTFRVNGFLVVPVLVRLTPDLNTATARL